MGLEQHRAAAVITFLVPGLRFFHEGQLEGRKVHVSMHLGRRPEEPPDPELRVFYRRLLAVLGRDEVHEGNWQLCECRPAWPENPSSDRFVVMAWDHSARERLLVAVNYGPTPAQCWVRIPFLDLPDKVLLEDLLGEARYEREGAELRSRGLYLDLPAWGHHAFAVSAV